jgi:hypothetical protein
MSQERKARILSPEFAAKMRLLYQFGTFELGIRPAENSFFIGEVVLELAGPNAIATPQEMKTFVIAHHDELLAAFLEATKDIPPHSPTPVRSVPITPRGRALVASVSACSINGLQCASTSWEY